jgi:hypothetical protein
VPQRWIRKARRAGRRPADLRAHNPQQFSATVSLLAVPSSLQPAQVSARSSRARLSLGMRVMTSLRSVIPFAAVVRGCEIELLQLARSGCTTILPLSMTAGA